MAKTVKVKAAAINKKKIVQAIKKTKVLPLPARKAAVRAVGLIDERILNLASKQYQRVVREISKRKSQLDQEGRVALELGERILTRAKAVRNAMTTTGSRPRRG